MPGVALVRVLFAPFLIQVPANAPEKATEDEPGAGISAILVGDPDGIPGSRLHLGLALVIFWGVNSQMENFSLFLSTSLSNSTFQLNKS